MRDQPTTIGPYRVLGRLGKGGFAQTFLVARPANGGPEHRLCLKRITTEFADDEGFRREFRDEALMLSLLNHDSIVKTFEYGEDDGFPYLVMELVEGCNLAQLLNRLRGEQRQLPASVAIYIAAEACSALAYAHTLTDADGAPLNIVHRDVSSGNILLSRYGAVKLFDFGIALASFRARGKHTETGAAKGTRAYMSFEHYNPALGLDARSDIFSLGVVLYEMLAGRLPYRNEDTVSIEASFRALSTGSLIPLDEVAPHLEPDLIALVQQMLSLNKEERPSSAREVRRRLLRMALRPDARDLLEDIVNASPSAPHPKQESAAVSTTDLPDIAAAKAVLAAFDPPTDGNVSRKTGQPTTHASSQGEPRSLRRPAQVVALAAVLCAPALYMLLPRGGAEPAKQPAAQAEAIQAQPALSGRSEPPRMSPLPPPRNGATPAPPAATASTADAAPAVQSEAASSATSKPPEEALTRKPTATVHVRVANYGWVSLDGRGAQKAPFDAKLRAGLHTIAVSLDESSPVVIRDRIKLQAGEERALAYDVTRFVRP